MIKKIVIHFNIVLRICNYDS